MDALSRRHALKLLAAAGLGGTVLGCKGSAQPGDDGPGPASVGAVTPLGMRWPTRDPFLFCVHHDDRYPPGNERLGPAASLEGRQLGRDFEPRDGWRMYHGEVVPGFPAHPHRGFETVTLVRRGLLDHSDSLGATARYGEGDVQWLTAGRGIQHAEMFPLLDPTRPNPVELFQIWLDLPPAMKMAAPQFSMLWNHLIPEVTVRDRAGRSTTVRIVAGQLGDRSAPPPPPSSWAAAAGDVAIWTLRMAPGASFTLPAVSPTAERSLYYVRGGELEVGGRTIPGYHHVEIQGAGAIELTAGDDSELLLLQGRPIGEPVVQRGPFVMNTPGEIEQAIADYRRTRFGGWPWAESGPVHPREAGRFARHADGRLDRPA